MRLAEEWKRVAPTIEIPQGTREPYGLCDDARDQPREVHEGVAR